MLVMMLGVTNAWAAEVTSAVTLSNGQYETDHITWTVDGITIQQLKGTSTNAVNSNYVASPRVYKGHILSFSANSGYAIKSISITYTGTYSGNSMTAGTELNGTTVTDNTTDVSRTWATVNDGTHVVSSVSEDGLSQIYIQNVASATNTQLRPTAISITYIAADDAKKIATVTIGESTLLVGATTTITTDGPEVTLTTSDASIASVSGSTITAEAAGAATITATWDENNEYEAGTKTFDVRVVEVTDGEFDFTTGYAYGSGLKQSVNQVTTTKTFTAGNITLTTSGNFAWNTDGTLRIYSGASYALAAPEGYIITKIAFTGTQNLTSVTVDSGSLSGNGTAATWTGRAQSVIITRDDANPFYNTITVTYEAQGDKEEAGLIYAPTSYTATIGGENTYPTLSNPNELDVTYESSNTGVATIDANGVVTLVAAGTTTITASSEEDETYNAGSASYTLTVVDPNAPGTENNPYTVAQARAAIDAGTGVTGVYATGIVTEIPTAYSTQYSNITFNFTDEGGSDILQAYRCIGDEAANVQVGDIVVVSGNLTKYNSTYEFASGCTLVSLTHPAVAVEAPTFSPVAGTYAEAQSVTISTETSGATIYYTTDGTDPTTSSSVYSSAIPVSTTTTIKAIAVKGSDESTVATATYYFCSATSPYTVTQALAFNEYPANEIYVTGIVSTAPTQAPTSNGELTYYISVDGEATNQLEVYKGKGLEQAAFTAQDDIQVGDIVTIFGNVVIYGTSNPIKEFATGNYLVSFERPVSTEPVINANATLSLAYDATSGEIGYTIENSVEGTSLSANTTADWISNITVGESAVTFTTTANEGDADRTATIILTYGEVTKEVTVTQKHYVVDYATLPFEFDGGKADIEGTNGLTQSGLGSDYSSAPKLKFDGSGDEMVLKFNEQPGILTFNIKGNSFSGGTFKVQTSADGVTYTDLETYTTLGDTQSEEFDNIATDVRYIKWVYTEKVNGNVALGNITLAKYTAKYAVNIDETITNGAVTADKTEAPEGATVTLTVEPAEGYVLDVLTVTGESGTAVDVENSTFVMPAEPVTVSATFTKAPVITDGYKKVTSTEDLTDGEYLIVYESSSVAFNGGLETLDAVSNTISVEISNNIIPSSTEVDAATFTIDVTAGTLKSKSGKYIGVSSNSNGLNQTEEAGTYTHTFSIDEDGNAVISAVFDESTMALRFNKTSGQTRFRYFKNAGQEAIQLYKKFTSSEFLAGDVNGDNQVSIADVTALVNIILGKATPDTNPEYDFDAADVNGDGGVPTIADVTALVNIILGKDQ